MGEGLFLKLAWPKSSEAYNLCAIGVAGSACFPKAALATLHSPPMPTVMFLMFPNLAGKLVGLIILFLVISCFSARDTNLNCTAVPLYYRSVFVRHIALW